MPQGEVTFEELDRFLKGVGFTQTKQTDKSIAYHHPSSDTLVLLPKSEPGSTVRPADLLSILVRLENRGLVDGPLLAKLKEGKLPLAS